MQALSYIALIAVLILFAGLSLGSLLLDRERKDEYLALVPILGVAGWITGLNFFFFITKNFALSAYIMFAVFFALAARAIRLKQAPPVSVPSLVALAFAFIFWIATLIPYIVTGPENFIGIFLGDAVNYAMEIDFFTTGVSLEAYAPGSAMASAAKLALFERGGFALFAALPAWITGVSGKAFVHPVSLLLSPLLFLSAYVVMRRLKLGALAIVIGLAVLLFNNFYLFNAYGAYSSKALGVPILLALLHILFDTLTSKTDKRKLALGGVLSAALLVTYWETAPVAVLFYLGLLFFNLKPARLKPLLLNSVVVLVLTLILAPNLYGIFTRGVLEKYHAATTKTQDGFWSTVRLEPYLLFASGLHGRLPAIDSAEKRMEPVDQWPVFWTKMNRDAASPEWIQKRWEASEDVYLSWRLFLCLGFFFIVGLFAFDRKNSYFNALGRFTTIGTFLFLITGPDKKVFYNFLFYASPYVFITWGAGLDVVYKRAARLAGRGALLIFSLPLFYVYLIFAGSAYMVYSAMENAHSSRLYSARNHIYYKYNDALKELGAFIRANVSKEKPIAIMDDRPGSVLGGWSALSYWLMYELKDFDARFHQPLPHFPSQTVDKGAYAEKTLIYMSGHRLLDDAVFKAPGVIHANENFIVSTSELKPIEFGLGVLPVDVKGIRSFDGSRGEVIRLSDETVMSGTKKFTIEFWLSSFERNLQKGLVSDVYPPMPCLIGPLALYQNEDDVIGISIKTVENETIEHSINEKLSGRWFHVALEVDNEIGLARLYINGKTELDIRRKLGFLRGEAYIGQGYPDKKRFWKGEMAGLKISANLRHDADFDPTMDKANEAPIYGF